MEKLEKHWGTSAVYGVDFDNRLASGETLASGAELVVHEALDGGAADDLTIASVSISGTRVIGTISGGKCLEEQREGKWFCRYVLMATVVTSAGERETECVELMVYDCDEQSAVYS
jgi:hypothetical protein